ncbi:Radical SAM domain protein [Methanothermus fervidus DSM 2088]|uniref:Radical SAM domain protein n=1 Tax=Methanothermus fervidus (strain ATCC 43054 / DSM 2088 / JCM 10308 / V24 S) TaxID=523846 RepID=E3GYI2_METFV|nr:Radical SAM domain protein [Methanothermus fervidus DSM 2088]
MNYPPTLANNMTLQIEISRLCNRNCPICLRPYISESQNQLMSFHEFSKICDKAMASNIFSYVALHGWGEPLLNPELSKMIKHAKNIGFCVSLTTNGFYLNEQMDKLLSSGLDEIAIGVYDINVLNILAPIIKEFIKKRENIKTYLDVTILKTNFHDLPKFIYLGKKIGVDAIIFHRLFNLHNPSIEYIPLEKESILFNKLIKNAKKLKIKIYLPTKHFYPCKVMRKSIFVTVDGDVTPCCFLPEYSIGNILRNNIEDILSSPLYYAITTGKIQPSICKRCYW